MNPKWVKCSERIPALEDKEVVVFFADSGCIDAVNTLDYFQDITNGFDEHGKQLYTKWYRRMNVTHWLEGLEYPDD